MNFIQNQHYSASIAITDKFICLNTRSGYGLLAEDPNFPSILLPTDCPNDVLGEKLIQALANSNTQLNNKQYEQLFNPKSLKEEWKIWLEMLKNQYGYRSKRQLLTKLLNCSAYLINKKITIKPSHHEKWEGWSGLDESKHVILSLGHSTEEIGAGLRLALSRCTTKEF